MKRSGWVQFILGQFLLLALWSSSVCVSAEQDQLGDPLPEEAVSRAGTVRPPDKIPADFPRPDSLRGAAISADGRILATYGEPADPRTGRPIQIWDARTGKHLRQLEGHEWPIRAIAMSPNGKTLVSSSFDVSQGAGITRIWDVASGESRHLIPDGGHFVRFDSDGNTFWLVVRDSLRVYQAANGQEVRRFLGPNLTFDISADGRFVLGVSHTRDTVIRLYDVNTKKELLKLEGMEGSPRLAKFSPDGKTVAVLDRSDNVLVWDVLTGRLGHQLIGHKKRPFAMTFSPDGRFLVTGGMDTVRVWELASGEEIHELPGHKGIVTVLEFAPGSNRLVTGSTDRTALVWNTANSLVSHLKLPDFNDEVLKELWNDLSSGTPSKAYLAAGIIRADEENTLPYLLDQMESLLIPSKNNRIANLIKDLDANDSTVRRRATAELKKLRKVAQPLLIKVLQQTRSAEVRARLRYILSGENSISRFSASDRLRMRRLIQLAEVSATPAARSLLDLLAGECPLPEIVKEAQSALARLDAK